VAPQSAAQYDVFDAIVAATAIATLAGLSLPRIWRSQLWRATVTPLASIIGSGFLIIAPILHALLGRWALGGIVFLCALSYAIGAAIRFNIVHAENTDGDSKNDEIRSLEMISQATLGIAYTVSVAFYSSLFVAFLLDRFSIHGGTLQPAGTTALLLAVGAVAWRRGTKGLESVELTAVTLKLSIIAAVIIALAAYDVDTGTAWFEHAALADLPIWHTSAVLGGLLMVTQGFETSRFMGARYDPATRSRASRDAQWIASIIYIAFIGVTCPLFFEFPVAALTETAINDTLGQAILVLPLVLFIAAAASQLSAALADTIGGGGLLAEISPYGLSERGFYAVVITVAIAIVWSFDVFSIINIASKGFAVFYLLQVVITKTLVARQRQLPRYRVKITGCWILIVLLVAIVVGSVPAPHA